MLVNMLRITIVAVGRIKAQWIAEGCNEYSSRLAHNFKLDIIELPAGRSKDPQKQCEEESEQILHHLQKLEGDIWLLDEKGSGTTSVKFSEMLGRNIDRGMPLTFVIGGAYGTDKTVKSAVQHHLKLSDMTLTHEMSRLVLLEQLYRASEIRKKSGYHH